MSPLFWVCAALVAFTYVGYPVVLIIASAFRQRRVRSEPVTPRVTLLIPAHNEEEVIERKIRSALALRYPPGCCEIVVASDGSTDGTHRIVESFAGQGVRLWLYPRLGKNALLNEAVPRAGGEIVVISDASVLLAPDSLEILVRPFADPDVGGAWANKIYRNPTGSAAGEGEGLYLRYEKFMKVRETAIGSIVAAEGSMFAFRRSLFAPLPPSVPDDFALSVAIVRRGYRLVYEAAALTYEETSPSDREEFRRKARIIHQGIRGVWIARDLLNPFQSGFYALSLLTRQFLRRAVAVLFPVLLALNVTLAPRGGIYLALLVGQGIFYLLALLGLLLRWRAGAVPALSLPYHICFLNAAALVGMWRALSGRESTMWSPTGRAAEAGAKGAGNG